MHHKHTIFPVILSGICLLFILFFLTGFSAYSQNSVNDSIKAKKTKVEHSPHKATIYSAVLPGLGQIYNHKYWKVPIVYGGFATLGYFINFNNGVYTKYKQAYSDIIDNDPNTNSYLNLKVNKVFFQPDKISQLTENLKRVKDGWRRNRDLVIIGTAVFYMINIIDASVDAHFFNFDISDDLTINWAPAPVVCINNKLVGLQCRINF
jgi:hypothetical protein